MSNFEMIFVGVNFLLTLVHSVYLLSKARITSLEKEALVMKAKIVADAQAISVAADARITRLEALATQAFSVSSQVPLAINSTPQVSVISSSPSVV